MSFQTPKHKYGTAKKTEYNGEVYSSKFEAQCAIDLDMRMASGEVLSWESQTAIDLVVNGYKIGVYNIDFTAKLKNGMTEYIEAKGTAGDTPLWRFKWKFLMAMMAERKDVKLTILWQHPIIKSVKDGKIQYQSVGEIKKVSK